MTTAVREQKPKRRWFSLTREQQNTWALRVIDMVIGVVLVLAMFIVKGINDDQKQMAVTQSRILERMAAIEASRFTATDGLDVWKAMASIKEQIASMPTEVPPPWFKEQVDGIGARLDRIEIRLNVMDRERHKSRQ